MYTVIKVHDPQSAKDLLIKARRVGYDVIGAGGLPRCAWCKLNKLRPLTDHIQRGFTMDFVQTVGYCEQCHKGTIVEYEIQHETESEVK
jgi:hypothetical protein